MIAGLNLAVDDVELHLATDASAPVDAAGIAVRMGTTEHHLRRMFSSLAGMPLSDYVRRRRMSLAAADRVTPTTTFSRSPSGTATAQPRRSGGHSCRARHRSLRCTAQGRSPTHTTANQVPPDR